MRKSLFLTLALTLVSFASVFAQEQDNSEIWSITLTTNEGLPGTEAVIDGNKVAIYQTGVITLDQASKLVRLTVVETNSPNDKVAGCNYPYFTMSELTVYTADLSRKIAYKATSNAINHTSANKFQWGESGIGALSDNNYGTYFHSDANKASYEYHYLDILLEEEVESFILEWAGRADYTRQCPTVVGITRDRHRFIPYTDIVFEIEEQITNNADLAKAKHVVLYGHAPEFYDLYDHSTGNIKIEDGEPQIALEGFGSAYDIAWSATKEATYKNAIQLIPIPEQEGKYLIYYPISKEYVAGNYEEYSPETYAWQGITKNPEDAAIVTATLIESGDNQGDFELSYEPSVKGAPLGVTVYIAPHTGSGRMSILNAEYKAHMDKHNWCPSMGRKLNFNWTIYNVNYEPQEWAAAYSISQMSVKLRNLLKYVEDDANQTIGKIIQDLEEIDTDNISNEKVNAIVEENAEIVSTFLMNLMKNEADFLKNHVTIPGQEELIKDHLSDTFKQGSFSTTVYNETVGASTIKIEELYDADNHYDHINEIVAYYMGKEAMLNTLYQSQYKGVIYGTYGSESDELPNEWTQTIEPGSAVNGFRMTILKANDGTAYGYPHVSFGTLEVFDADGEKVELTADLLTTNSLCKNQGSLGALLDETTTTFYQSIWNDNGEQGEMNPVGYVYIDVKFPDDITLDKFTIKTNVREPEKEDGYKQDHSRPKIVVIGKYGEAYGNYEIKEENSYNIAVGNAVTSADALVDGGIYLIRGNCYKNTKPADAEETFRFYSGIKDNAYANIESVNEDNLYMFIKDGEAWNILSLKDCEYWAAPEIDDYTAQSKALKADAAKIKIEASTNIDGTFVLYSELPEDSTQTASFEFKEVVENEVVKYEAINIEEKDVVTSKLVFMDWEDVGLSARPCVNQQPGVFEYGYDVINNHALKDSLIWSGPGYRAGDDLHFNKANGEGEWNIYEFTSNSNVDLIFLNAVVKKIEEVGLNPGSEPGCIIVDDETLEEYNNTLAAANVALSQKDATSAKTLALQLMSLMEEINQNDYVSFDKNATYTIVSAYPEYKKLTGNTRAIYADVNNNEIKWKVNPEYFASQFNREFLFNIIPVDRAIATKYRLTDVKEEDYNKAVIIKMATEDRYIGPMNNNKLTLVTEETLGFNVFMPVLLGQCQFNIKSYGTNNMLHTNDHGQGNGYGSNIVYFTSGLNSASSWKFVTVSAEELATEVTAPVVEGAEVIAVRYFTIAGAEIAEPVKGINIVVTIYSNGVIESKKILKK